MAGKTSRQNSRYGCRPMDPIQANRTGVKVMKRRTARQIAVQCLYQSEMNDIPVQTAVETIVEQMREEDLGSEEPTDEGIQFVHRLIEGTQSRRKEIDGIVSGYLTGWKVDRLSMVDRQILRMAVYEMFFIDDVPPKVVVNEAIELSKMFGGEESGKFVNGVMGKIINEAESVKVKLSL